MSARKVRHSHLDLNLSGFSPIKPHSSPSSSSIIKSPAAKDCGIQEAIDSGREKIVAGYDKWKIACLNGSQYINQIHSIKSRAREYTKDLEIYCQKLEIVRKVLESVISAIYTFKSQITSSIKILETLNDKALELREISFYLSKLIILYEKSFQRKSFIIENIAHANSEDQSHFLVASWSDDLSHLIFKLVTQLKISPSHYHWRN